MLFETFDTLHGSLEALEALEHSGQLKKTGLELLQNPGSLSGEIMTQTKEKKAIETLKCYKRSK